MYARHASRHKWKPEDKSATVTRKQLAAAWDAMLVDYNVPVKKAGKSPSFERLARAIGLQKPGENE